MQFSPLLTFLISFLCNSYSIPSASSLNDEGSALLSFKRSITQDPSFSLSNWNSSDSTPCSWNGITCSKQQKVVSLSIPNKKLSGPLSPSLASLPEIRHINLRSNRLHGPLPPALFRAARGLQSLVLYGNHLSGPLPPDLGNLEFLQTLDLSRNLLSGSLPASLLRCKRLRTLDFSRNNLTGPIPPEIGAALGGTLRTVDLSRNLLSGPIPGSLGELSELQGTLDLSRNAFAGPVPADLGRLPEKVYIDLTYNNLSGPIPQNGALVNRGPTAFIGNVGLCGPPLKKPCSFLAPPPPGLPDFPTNSSTRPGKSSGRRGMSKGSVALIVICDLVGICVIGLLCSFCYLRIRGGRVGKEKKGREFPCFKKEMLSEEESEEDDLVGLDGRKLSFDLDELLKASAFVLGKSGIGILYKVVLEDGQCLAVRRLGEGGAQRFKEFQTEVEAIGKLRHPNIVNLRGYYWSVDEKLLIYDLVQNGNLATAIHGKPGMAKFDPMPWSVRLKIMKGVARGLIYIHEHSPKKYVHGNLKPSNILLSSDAGPMISDFGLSRLALITGAGSGGSPPAQSNRTTTTTITAFENQLLESSVPTSASLRSSSHYQAPESLRAVKPSQKWDVYSYGVILLEMITGREVDLVRWMEVCLEERRSMLEVVDPHLVREEEREDEEIITVLKIAMACAQAGPERRPAMRHVVDSIERVGPSYD